MERILTEITSLASFQHEISEEGAKKLIRLFSNVFTQSLIDDGHNGRQIRRLTTKFRDAGRRSPPWRPTSSRVPGRPQDGANGNRISRWLLPEDHKFYADEINATLVEVRYYLQALSMDNGPIFPTDTIQHCFYPWLIEHPVEPGNYIDPIQLIPINLNDVIDNARIIQSGHLVPLNRGGKHEPSNTFLMLKRSNDLQGDLTVDELLELMKTIGERHRTRGSLKA